MAKKKTFKTDFKGFTYNVSVPSADFEGESASEIKEKLRDHLKKWYGTCYRELIAKFQSDFEIETSNNKKASITARYENGYASLEGSISQQVNEPADDSKRIKFPIAGTEKFIIIDKYIVGGVVAFSRKFSQHFAREIRDGWIKEVKELTPEEGIIFWNKNEKIIHLQYDMLKELPINHFIIRGGKSIQQHIKDEFEGIVYFELTDEGKNKYNASGFYRGDQCLNEIRKWVVEKQIPIEVEDNNSRRPDGAVGSWDSYVRRGLLEIAETLSFKEIKQRGFLTPIDGRSPFDNGYTIEARPMVRYLNGDERLDKLTFNTYKLTAKGKVKYDEGIIKLLNKEETDRIEGKTF